MPSNTLFSRRSFAILAAAGISAGSLPVAANALTVAQASELVGRLVNEIQAVADSGRSEQQMFGDFERILATYGDMPIIAQTVLGVDWRRATGSQRSSFTRAFQGYMSRKYGRRFREFIGGRVEVNDARAVRNFYEVISTVHLRGEAPFELRWLVSDGSGQNRFFNLIIEGINLRTTERTEIGAILDRNGGNIDGLIRDLNNSG